MWALSETFIYERRRRKRMYEDILTEIGLTKSEIHVYLALLKLGSTTTGPIIKNAGIASGKAYLILDKLLKKGLVTYSIKAGTKHYQAKDPERLLEYLQEKEAALRKKEEQLKSIIPLLKQEYKERTYKPLAEVFEGVKGFKTFYEWTLKELQEGECIDVMGAPREANEKFQAYLLNWNKRRIKQGIRMRIIYNHDCKDFGEEREKMELTEVRYMNPNLETPAWIDIFKESVATINVHGTPLCFLIRNREAATTYKNYFEFLWKESSR